MGGNYTMLPLTNEARQEAKRLLADTGKKHRIGQIVRAMLRDDPPNRQQTALLFKALQWKEERWKARTLAAWALSRLELPTKQRNELEALLVERIKHSAASVADRHKMGKVVFRTVLASLFLLLIGAVFSPLLFPDHSGLLLISPLIVLSPLIILLSDAAGRIGSRLTTPEEVCVLLRILGREGTLEAIPIVALSLLHPETAADAAVALQSIDLKLTPEHYGFCPPDTTQALCRALAVSDPKIVVCLLSLLKKVGGGSAIEPVGKLFVDKRNTEVQKSARQALPSLHARKMAEDMKNSLLRASGAGPHTPAELMLRPAASVSTPHELLLRAEQE